MTKITKPVRQTLIQSTPNKSAKLDPKKQVGVRQTFGKDEMSSGAGRALRARAAKVLGASTPRPHTLADDDDRGASTTVKVSGGTIDASTEVKGKAWSVSFGTQVSSTSDVTSKDGVTTITQDGSLSVSFGAKVDVKAIGFGAQVTNGVKTHYQVQLPTAAYEAGAKPDPYNPSTLPVGTVVLMSSADYKGTAFEASYKAIALSTKSNIEKGVSTTIEKTGENTVRVTVGPTELVQKNFELGVSLGPASVSIGNERKDTSFTMKTAEFDLSTKEGKAAYDAFLATGKMPTDNSKGVSGVATISRDTSDASVSVGAELGPWSGSTTISSESYASVVTTYPDGSADRTIDAQTVNGSPLHASVHYRPDGTVDESKTTFSFFYKGAGGDVEGLFADAYKFDKKIVKGSKDIELSFTPEQSATLTAQAAAYYKQTVNPTGQRDPGTLSGPDYLLYKLSIAKTPEEVASALADAPPGVVGYALELLKVNGAAPAGTVSVRDRNAS